MILRYLAPLPPCWYLSSPSMEAAISSMIQVATSLNPTAGKLWRLAEAEGGRELEEEKEKADVLLLLGGKRQQQVRARPRTVVGMPFAAIVVLLFSLKSLI